MAHSQDRPRILSDRLVAELVDEIGGKNLSVGFRTKELAALRSIASSSTPLGPEFGITLLSIAPDRWMEKDFRIQKRVVKVSDSESVSDYMSLEADRSEILLGAEMAGLRRVLHRSLADLTLWREENRIISEDLAWLSTMISLKEDRFKIRQPKHNELMALQNGRSLNEALLLNVSNRINLAEFRVHRLLNQESNQITRTVILPRPFGLVDFSTNLVLAAAEGSFEILLLLNGLDLAAIELNGDKSPKSGARMKEALQLRVADARSRLAERVMTLSIEIANRGRLIGAYRDEIQLRGQESVASAMSLWEVNRGSLDEVLRERRKLIADQLELVRQTIQQQKALADLLYLCGRRTLLDLHKRTREISSRPQSGEKKDKSK